MKNRLFFIGLLALSFNLNAQMWVPATPFPGASGSFGPNSNLLGTRVNCLYEFNGDLIVAGNFNAIGGIVAHCIAKWNGASWSSLGPGNYLQDTYVTDLCEYNNKLFVAAGELKGWDGAQWSDFSYFNTNTGQSEILTAIELHVFNNELYVITGNAELIKYNGVSYTDLAIPISIGSPICIEDFNGELYIGTNTGVYKYDNQSWINCNGIVTGNPQIFDLETYNGELYAIGYISSIGGLSVKNLAKYNGSSWSNIIMPNGFWPILSAGAPYVSKNCLVVQNNNLYVSAAFGSMEPHDFDPSPLFKFDGTIWSPLAINFIATDGSDMGNTSIIYQGDLYSGGRFWALAMNFIKPIVTNYNVNCFIKLDPNLTNINEINTTDFLIYPNPTSNNITIQAKAGMNQNFKFFDQMGREVISGKLNGINTEVNLSALSKGMYTLKIEGNYQPAQIVKE
jgi:hypothetical protein